MRAALVWLLTLSCWWNAAAVRGQAVEPPGAEAGAAAVEPPAASPPAPAATAAPADQPLPPEADLSSPRAAMFTFLRGMERVDQGDPRGWELALSALDLSRVDPADAPDLAEKLLSVLDRLGEVREAELPDARAAAELARFRYFPRRGDHDWLYRKLEQEPDGQLVLERDAAGAWRFSARSVAQLEPLHASLRTLPPRYVKQAGEHETLAVLGETFERTPWWGWLALLGWIFLGLLAGRILKGAFQNAAKRRQGEQRQLMYVLLQDAMSPASVALLTLGLTIGRRFIHLEPQLAQFAHTVLKFLYLLALAWLLFNLVDIIELLLRRVTDRSTAKLGDMVVPLIRKTLRIFLVVVFSLVVAQNVFGLNVTGWLAGLGIAGLAVSLAAQDSIKNLFGSITVFFDKPFAVGDRIKFDDYDGPVEEIGFRSTKVRTLEGHLVTIPNMKFIDSNVENIGARPSIRRWLNVTITYDTPPEKIEQAIEIARDILAEPEFTAAFDMQELPPRVAFNDFNADSLNILVLYWFTLRDGRDFWAYLDHAQRFNLRLFRAFGEAGIEFAFPTQTVYLAGDRKRQLEVTMHGERFPPEGDGQPAPPRRGEVV